MAVAVPLAPAGPPRLPPPPSWMPKPMWSPSGLVRPWRIALPSLRGDLAGASGGGRDDLLRRGQAVGEHELRLADGLAGRGPDEAEQALLQALRDRVEDRAHGSRHDRRDLAQQPGLDPVEGAGHRPNAGRHEIEDRPRGVADCGGDPRDEPDRALDEVDDAGEHPVEEGLCPGDDVVDDPPGRSNHRVHDRGDDPAQHVGQPRHLLGHPAGETGQLLLEERRRRGQQGAQERDPVDDPLGHREDRLQDPVDGSVDHAPDALDDGRYPAGDPAEQAVEHGPERGEERRHHGPAGEDRGDGVPDRAPDLAHHAPDRAEDRCPRSPSRPPSESRGGCGSPRRYRWRCPGYRR